MYCEWLPFRLCTLAHVDRLCGGVELKTRVTRVTNKPLLRECLDKVDRSNDQFPVYLLSSSSRCKRLPGCVNTSLV